MKTMSRLVCGREEHVTRLHKQCAPLRCSCPRRSAYWLISLSTRRLIAPAMRVRHVWHVVASCMHGAPCHVMQHNAMQTRKRLPHIDIYIYIYIYTHTYTYNDDNNNNNHHHNHHGLAVSRAGPEI